MPYHVLQTAEEMLLEQSEDGGSTGTAYRPSSFTSAGAAAVRSHPVAGARPNMGDSSSSRLTVTGQRPPSPRSLLASAKAGSMFVTSTSAPLAGSAHTSAYDQQDSEDDDEVENCGHITVCVRMGSLKRAAHKLDRDGSLRSTESSSALPAAAGTAAAAADHNSPAASGSSTPRSKRRESLQR
jgi:hypothetical protein